MALASTGKQPHTLPHEFDNAYGTCLRCGTSQREAVGTRSVPPVPCLRGDELPIITDEAAVEELRRGESVFIDIGDGRPVEAMAVPRCETCRWWGNGGDEEAFSVTNRRKCRRMTAGDNRPVETYQGVALYTAPDFGCVRWEAKSDEG